MFIFEDILKVPTSNLGSQMCCKSWNCSKTILIKIIYDFSLNLNIQGRVSNKKNLTLLFVENWEFCYSIWAASFVIPFEPTKWHVRPAKTRISLGICPVWSESLLSTWRKLGSLATHWEHSEDSDQTGRMPRLIWVFAGCTCHFVGFDMRRLICLFGIIPWQALALWWNTMYSIHSMHH